MAEESSNLSFQRYSGLILRYNIDLVKREISLVGPITMKTLIKLDKALKLLEIQPDDITIVLNTSGGDIEAALGIIDRIRCSSSKIHMIGTGIIMSAGIPILAAGATRKATRFTRFMYHCPSASVPFTRLGNIDTEVKYIKELGKVIDKFLAEATGKSYAFWTTLGKHVDHNFDAEKAMEYNLIDEIL